MFALRPLPTVGFDEGGFMLASAHRPERPWIAHYPRDVALHLDYPDEPLHWLLQEAAQKVPSRIAARFFSQELTYEQLLAQSRLLATALRERASSTVP